MATARQSIPFVVGPQAVPAPEVISQTELAMFISLRGRLHQLESQVETAEQSIKQRLEHGASVEHRGGHRIPCGSFVRQKPLQK